MLTHLEFEQVKRALDRMRGETDSYKNTATIQRQDVIDLLLTYTEGFEAPNPHPLKDKPMPGPTTA